MTEGALAFLVLKENQDPYKDKDNGDPIGHSGFLIDGTVVAKNHKTGPEIGIGSEVI